MTYRLERMGQEVYKGLTVLNNREERHFNGTVRCVPEALERPLRWKKPRRIFVNSMSDLFHKNVPFEFIDQVFAVMALTPQHTYQVLTKRPERAAEYLASRTPTKPGHVLPPEWLHYMNDVKDDRGRNLTTKYRHHRKNMHRRGTWPLPNLWLGTSCGHQEAADEMIPHLLNCPAAVRFLSVEPMTGPVDLSGALRNAHCAERLHWVIVGGESGPGARPCNIQWIRDIVKQCNAAQVPVFVKQLGKQPYSTSMIAAHRASGPRGAVMIDTSEGRHFCLGLADPKGGDPTEWPEDLRVREFPPQAQRA